MTEHGLRHLPVLEHGKLVGILTQRDLYFLETVGNLDPEVERVEEGMSQEVYCVAPEARIEDVAAEMAAHKYGCAVVVEGHKVVGVFTTIDALEVLVQCLQRGQ
jgi:acetoin utilization protein AcuB